MALSAARREDRRQNIVTAAQALLRERAASPGSPAFSMAELAARAGVSAATPYNLVGSRSEVLRLVVRAEFGGFVEKLAGLASPGPLSTLLDAADLVVSHYEADRDFYLALYGMAYSADAGDLHEQMLYEGRALWSRLVSACIISGEMSPVTRVEPFCDVLLRTLTAVTLGWLSEGWPHARFSAEMGLSVRLILAGLARDDVRLRLVAEIDRLQQDLSAMRVAR